MKKVIIIGSGPAGYTAAIYAARAGLEPLVIAGSVTAGGALINTTEVENYPGFSKGIMGPELMEEFREQAERFGAEILYDDAIRVDLTKEIKIVDTGYSGTFEALTVILSTGAEHKSLGVPGEERLTGHGVSTCATCDGFFQKDKDVVVIGGGDTALEEATFLARFAKTVTIIHRRDEFRASKAMVRRLENHSNINIIWNSVVEGVNGESKVENILVKDVKEDKTEVLPVEGVFVAIGHSPRSELFKEQVSVDSEGYVIVEHPTTKTNLSGVFACGDLVDNHYRQAITAAGSGCAAALDAQHYLEELESK